MSAERLKVVSRHLSPATASYITQLNEFRYTLNNPALTWDERKFYEENGYLVKRDFIDHEILDDCREHFVDLCEGRADKGAMTMMKEITALRAGATGEYLYYKAQDILYDEVFQRFFLNEKLLDVVECFTGPNIKGMHSMLINKPPDCGKTSRHPLHQDLYYFPFRPADRIVAAWTAIERVTNENGCLVVEPGSHRRGQLLPHGYPTIDGEVNKAFHGILDYNSDNIVELPMEKGDTVFFHPLLVHGSLFNRSKNFRKALTSHYASSDCFYIDVQGTVQDEIAHEIEEMASKKGYTVTIQEVWQYRSRLMRGREGSL